MEVLAAPPGPQHARELPRWMVVSQQAAAADGRRGPLDGQAHSSHRSSARCRELPTAFHTTVAGTCFVWCAMMPGIAGAKESSQQLEVLRERWPLAFPIKHQDVRPLAASTVGVITATMGWSSGYTRGLLFGWKMTAAYCRAVLLHDQRTALDGTPAEPVDAKAKDLAAQRLAQIAAKAAKKAAVMAKPKPAAPLAAPAPLRDQVRAALLRRGA